MWNILEFHERRSWDEPLPLLTVAHENQYTRVSAGRGYGLLFFLESLYGGSVLLGLAKSSDSSQEARLGGLHLVCQVGTVGEFPEVVGCSAVPLPPLEMERFMLPQGKGYPIAF